MDLSETGLCGSEYLPNLTWCIPNIGIHRASISKMYEIQNSCNWVENNGGPRKIFKHESGNSILLGTGASPHVSGNSILDTNVVKEFRTFLRLRPCENLYWEIAARIL